MVWFLAGYAVTGCAMLAIAHRINPVPPRWWEAVAVVACGPVAFVVTTLGILAAARVRQEAV